MKHLNQCMKAYYKIKDYAFENWIGSDTIIKHNIKTFECQFKENKQHKIIGTENDFTQTKSFVYR